MILTNEEKIMIKKLKDARFTIQFNSHEVSLINHSGEIIIETDIDLDDCDLVYIITGELKAQIEGEWNEDKEFAEYVEYCKNILNIINN